jgi:hypothetical protein
MKNKLLLFLIVISLAILPNLSSAQTRATTTKANVEKRDTIKAVIDAKKEAVKNSAEEIRLNAIAKIKNVVDKFVQNVLDRYSAAIARLGKLADRIDSRIAKMEAKKIDVSKAKELMVTARAKIETARVSTILINLPANTASSTATTTIASLKENFKVAKTALEKAKTDIKAAQAALVDVVNSLKPGDEKLRGSATTTATTTNNE